MIFSDKQCILNRVLQAQEISENNYKGNRRQPLNFDDIKKNFQKKNSKTFDQSEMKAY